MLREGSMDGEDFISPATIYTPKNLTEIISTLAGFKESGVVETLDIDPAVKTALDHAVTTGLELALQSLYLYYTTQNLHGWARAGGISDRDELEEIDKPTLRLFAKALEDQSERDRNGTSHTAQAFREAQDDKVREMFEQMMREVFPDFK